MSCGKPSGSSQCGTQTRCGTQAQCGTEAQQCGTKKSAPSCGQPQASCGIPCDNVVVPPTFRYTLNNPRLTLAQRQFYEDNGFLVIPGLFDGRTLDRFAKRFDDITEGRVPMGMACLMKEVSYVKQGVDEEREANYKLQDITFDEVFQEYVTCPKLLDYVECFVGPNIAARHSMLINKSPDLGTLSSRHPPHQDMFYFPFRPIDRCVATWTAMEKITVDNGCVYVYPGSHKGEMLPHDYPKWEGGVNKGFLGIQEYQDQPKIKTLVEMNKGDVLFFHPLLVHGSGLNLTKGFRKAISCHYATSDAYYIDVEGTIQEQAARELEDITSAHGPRRSFVEIWEVRRRQVRPAPTASRLYCMPYWATFTARACLLVYNPPDYGTLSSRLELYQASCGEPQASCGDSRDNVVVPPTGTFRYTLNNPRLTLAQRQFYEDNGFLVIPGLFDDRTLDRLAKRFDDITEGRVPTGQLCLMKEISGLKQGVEDERDSNFQLLDITFDEVFKDHITCPKLLDYVECFVGPNISARHSMLINKSADLGTHSSRHLPHQDVIFFPFRPIDRCVATWIAMEKTTADNGCIYVYPGSHKGEMPPHDNPIWERGVKKGFLGVQEYHDMTRPKTMVEMNKGDVLFFHPLLVHGSGLNLTKGSRKAISSHYATSDADCVDITGTSQGQAAKESKDITSALRPKKSFVEIWENQARQVRPSLKAHL